MKLPVKAGVARHVPHDLQAALDRAVDGGYFSQEELEDEFSRTRRHADIVPVLNMFQHKCRRLLGRRVQVRVLLAHHYFVQILQDRGPL